MDSKGLTVLIRQSRRFSERGGSVRLRDAPLAIRRLLELCCLEDLLEPQAT
jgi:anti-anti-sigma factor